MDRRHDTDTQPNRKSHTVPPQVAAVEASPQYGAANPLHQLQQTAGNQAVQAVLAPGNAIRLDVLLTGGQGAQFTVEVDTGESLSATGTAQGMLPGMYQVYYSYEQGRLLTRSADGSDLPPGSDLHFYIAKSPDMERIKHLLTATAATIPMEVRGTDEQGLVQLPERIRDVMFSQQAASPLQPGEYPVLLSAARKLMELSDSELEAYRARSTGTTTDARAFEASVDHYLAEVRQRREAGEAREHAKMRLYRLDDVYRQYLEYTDMLSTSAKLSAQGGQSPEALGTSLGMQPTLNKMAEELTANLQPYGFNSITEFEQAIHDFERAFRDETVLIAKEMLDRFEHTLVEQEQRYQKTEQTKALYQQLQPARQHFQQAINIREGHAQMPLTPDEMAEQAYWSGQFQQERKQGRAATSALSETQPLLPRMDLSQQEEVSLASEGDIQSVILKYIRDRRSDVQKTRRNLEDKPEMVFELDTLLEAAYTQLNIRPGSMYRSIIEHHIHDKGIERTIINLALAVFAIAAGLVSGGTGTVAVLGATTAFGISSYQAFEEYRRYEMMSAAHGAQLLTDDPSFAWVVVALVGAGVDLAVVGSTLRTIRPAIETFNKTSMTAADVAALEKQLAQLTQDDRIIKNVIRGAKAEAQEQKAWRSIFKPPAALRAVIIPGAEEFAKLVYAVYRTIRKVGNSFERFVLTREGMDLIGDVAKLAPEELTTLKAAYIQAIQDMEIIAKEGQSLGMAENEVEAFLRMWNNKGSMTIDQVKQEMHVWRAAKQSGVPFGFKSAEHFNEFRNTAQTELAKLLRRFDPDAQAFLQGSSVTGISYARQVPFDLESDLDVAISSKYLFRQGKTKGFEVSPSPSRIGPLTDEQIDALGLNRMRDRLSKLVTEEAEEAAEAAGAAEAKRPRHINFILFNNEEAVTKPIGEASKEVARPTIPLGGEE